MLCDHKIKAPLSYYYDDDWGFKGDEVWYNDPNKGDKRIDGQLKVCVDCGQVFAVPAKTIDKD